MVQTSFDCPHFSCFSHTLQLAVKQALKTSRGCKDDWKTQTTSGILQLFLQVKLLVMPEAACTSSQAAFPHPGCHNSLELRVLRTWLSAYWHSSNHFVPDLRRGDMMPTDEEFATMEIFVEVMKPLVDITEALGAQQWATISTVRPLLHKPLNSCLKPTPSNSSLVKIMKQKMLDDFRKHYTGSTYTS